MAAEQDKKADDSPVNEKPPRVIDVKFPLFGKMQFEIPHFPGEDQVSGQPRRLGASVTFELVTTAASKIWTQRYTTLEPGERLFARQPLRHRTATLGNMLTYWPTRCTENAGRSGPQVCRYEDPYHPRPPFLC